MDTLLGYAGAMAMGLMLGLMGGGGSILAIPILVYLFHVDAISAISYSFLIVGITSLFGAISHIRQGNYAAEAVWRFGIASIVAVAITRYFVLAQIPDQLAHIGDFVLTKSVFLLMLFAVLMLVMAYKMIVSTPVVEQWTDTRGTPHTLMYRGLAVGSITGLLGAGGGFMIVPSLVFFADLDIKKAIGTSLLIISANSFVGFVFGLAHHQAINWHLLLFFLSLAITGSMAGSFLSRYISGERLRPAFGWLVLVVGVYIIAREVWRV